MFTEFGQHITFQYISCYCLSRYLLPDLVPHCYFNTSHVTVYRCAAISLTFLQYHFNTSHVTVYRVQELCLHERSGISIHLMLLFILASRPIRIVLMDFNTSHVTVYQCEDKIRLKVLTFQYISCYCLSSCDPAMCKGI